jgi:hypothetical protein
MEQKGKQRNSTQAHTVDTTNTQHHQNAAHKQNHVYLIPSLSLLCCCSSDLAFATFRRKKSVRLVPPVLCLGSNQRPPAATECCVVLKQNVVLVCIVLVSVMNSLAGNRPGGAHAQGQKLAKFRLKFLPRVAEISTLSHLSSTVSHLSSLFSPFVPHAP